MTDQLEDRLRSAANGGDVQDLDDLMIEAAGELARLREREQRLEEALRRAERFIANGNEFGFIRPLSPVQAALVAGVFPAIRAALNDTAAPTPEEASESCAPS